MDIKLYQINMDRDTDLIAFMNLELLPKFQKQPGINSAIYDQVFEGTVDAKTLEDLYAIFNLKHPQGFAGRSMSVSDVVEVCSGKGPKPGFYFCDSFGFKEISFQPDKVKETTQNTIRVVLLEPGKTARAANIEANLQGMQQVVGGDIEPVYHPFEDEGVCMVVNEEGKINGMPLNRAIYADGEMIDIIAGPAFLCDCSGSNFGSLNDDQIEKYSRQFYKPERFIKMGERILAIPYFPPKENYVR